MRPQIHLYRFFFIIKYPFGRFIQAIYQLSGEYTTFDQVYDPFTRRKKWKPAKTFGICIGGGQQFRFHINQHDEFIRILHGKGITPGDYDVVVHEPPVTSNVKLPIRSKYVLRTDYGMDQEAAKDFVLQVCRNKQMPLLAMATGTGKALPLDTDIKTPFGWRKLSTIKIGTVIETAKGKPTLVTGYYPQGPREVYIIEFEDGRRARCDANHLWGVYYTRFLNGYPINGYTVLTTLDVEEKLNAGKEILSIPTYKGHAPGNKQHYQCIVDDKEEAYRQGLKIKSEVFTNKVKYFAEYTDHLRIRQVIKTDEVVEMACIAIKDESKLFVINDYIVTHNTVTSSVAVSEVGKRLLVFVLSKYVDKWVSDVHDIFDIDKREICKIQGGDQLVNATHWTKDKQTLRNNPLPKVFVVSIDTFSIWLKKYERDPEAAELDAYGCKPWEFFKSLDVGFVIFDEAHEHLHKLYRLFTYLDVQNVACCTATMISKNPTISRVQFMMFPQKNQFTEIKMKQYIEVYACCYQITNFQTSNIKTSYPGDNRYSHTAFEESILKHKVLRKQYIDMVCDLVAQRFVKETLPGEGKLILFVGSVDMGNAISAEIKRRWSKYDTRTYFQEDPYSNIIEADIRITTIISGSTAVDIKNLTTCIMTNCIDSPVSNLQALGRLREIVGKFVRFFYIYSSTIEKQREYHFNKVELFRPKVKSQTDVFIGTLFSS